MSRIVLGLLHNYNTFVYSRFFNFNILHSFNNKPRVSLYATPLTQPVGLAKPMCGLRGSRGRCWYAYYPYRAEFGEEFSTVAISGVLEPGASDPQMRDFSGTEI